MFKSQVEASMRSCLYSMPLSRLFYRGLAETCLAMLLLASISPPTSAQSFSDDFDGDSPVVWTTSPADAPDTSFMIEGGSMVISNTDFAWLVADQFVAQDVSIRTRMRLTSGTAIGISARYTPFQSPVDNIFAGVDTDGVAFAGFGGPGVPVTAGAEKQTSLDVLNSDVNLELEVTGNDVSFWAWPEPGQRPDEPTGTFTRSLSPGAISLWAVGDGSTQAEFRFVDVTVIPEPSTCLMLSATLFVLLIDPARSVRPLVKN